MYVSDKLVIKNSVAATAVLRLRKFAEPLEPNRLPAEPVPNAAPMSAPLPCCINTRPINTTAVKTCTTQTNVSTYHSPYCAPSHYARGKINLTGTKDFMSGHLHDKSPKTRRPPVKPRRSSHHQYPASQTILPRYSPSHCHRRVYTTRTRFYHRGMQHAAG